MRKEKRWRETLVEGFNGDAGRDVHVPVKLIVSSFGVSHNFVSFLARLWAWRVVGG